MCDVRILDANFYGIPRAPTCRPGALFLWLQEARGYVALGLARMATRDFSDAKKEFEKAVAIDPDYPGGHTGVCWIAQEGCWNAQEGVRVR